MATGLGRWEITTVGTGTAVEITSDRARNGRQSAKFTIASGATAEAYIRRKFHRPITGRVGVEASVNLGVLDASSGVYFEMFLADSSFNDDGRQSYSMVWNFSTEKLFRLGSAASLVEIEDDTAPYSGTIVSASNWNTLKMVVNTETYQYEKFVFNNRLYDLRGEPALQESFVSAEGDRMSLICRVHGGVGGTVEAYLDDVIFTQNEPELV